MDSPERHEKIKSLVEQLQKKQDELVIARKRDAEFEEKKLLFLELKALNEQLQNVLEESNIDPLR